MCRSVAPSAPSIPIARSRRCASTVNPPTDTSAMRSIASVTSASTIVSGLNVLLGTADDAVCTFGPIL